MLTDEQKEARRSGIGGSDIAAICGESRYKTAMDVYLEKTGAAPEKEENDSMYWGNVLEDIVAREFERRSALRIQRVNKLLRHPEHEYFLANIDRAIVNPEISGVVRVSKSGGLTTDQGLECKTASEYTKDQWGESGTDDVPTEYLLQCQWYMLITGCRIWHLAVLIGGNDFRRYVINRDDEIIEMIAGAAQRFWCSIEQGIPPEPQSFDEAKIRWPKDNGNSVIVGQDFVETCHLIKDLGKQKDEIEEKIKRLKATLVLQMGAATEATNGGKKIATWKNQTSTRIDIDRLREERPSIAEEFEVENETRVFRINTRNLK